MREKLFKKEFRCVTKLFILDLGGKEAVVLRAIVWNAQRLIEPFHF
jgi:hypothetical protein